MEEIKNFKQFISAHFENCPDVLEDDDLLSTSGIFIAIFVNKSFSILDSHSG